jgi:glyoxylase-like metal-dependent hydrolase (beta-lactamase superfamily II)
MGRQDAEVADGVRRLANGVSNFYLVEDRGKLLLVDAGTPGDWPALGRAVSALGRALTDIEAVILTHVHTDHVGFAEQARTAAGAAVWAHEADAPAARAGKAGPAESTLADFVLRPQFYRTLFLLIRSGAARMIPVKEVSSFADGEVLDLPGRPRAVHVPGHTAGSTALFLESRGVLFTGDVLVTRNPFTGRTGPQLMPPAATRDSAQALGSLDLLEVITAGQLLPGHGEPWAGGVPEAVRQARAAAQQP